jgi:uncharacterized membrane protein YeiH
VINDLQEYLHGDEIRLPETIAVLAIGLFSLTGVLAGLRRGYDVVGTYTLALVVGTGGGLLRDGIFLQQGPPALTQDWKFLPAVFAACVVGWLMNHWIVRFEKVIAILDAVGLSIFSMVGLLKSIDAGLSAPAAILVGIVNAAGGGLLRDILTREEPLLFKPGQFYVLASLAGCVVFVFIGFEDLMRPRHAVQVSMIIIFVLRILAIRFNWRTSSVQPWFPMASVSPKPPPVDPLKTP